MLVQAYLCYQFFISCSTFSKHCDSQLSQIYAVYVALLIPLQFSQAHKQTFFWHQYYFFHILYILCICCTMFLSLHFRSLYRDKPCKQSSNIIVIVSIICIILINHFQLIADLLCNVDSHSYCINVMLMVPWEVNRRLSYYLLQSRNPYTAKDNC